MDEGVGFLVVTVELLLSQVLLGRLCRLEIEVADPRLLDHPRVVLLCGVLVDLASIQLQVLWEFTTQDHLDRASFSISYDESVERVLVDDLQVCKRFLWHGTMTRFEILPSLLVVFDLLLAGHFQLREVVSARCHNSAEAIVSALQIFADTLQHTSRVSFVDLVDVALRPGTENFAQDSVSFCLLLVLLDRVNRKARRVLLGSGCR